MRETAQAIDKETIMSSILTNNSAMVALQTLKGINMNLNKTQSEISTGKSVATSKDNSAVWAISKTMESDVKGFKGISDSLSLGSSTISVARQASETVTDLLTEIKGKVVASQEKNVDREKIQTDIKALREQIKSVVGAAQFNGLNLIDGKDDIDILASLDRSGGRTVSASSISVSRQDLTTKAGVYGSTALTAASYGAIDGAAPSGTTSAATGSSAVATFAGTVAQGDEYSLTVGGTTVNYTAATGDDADAVRDFFAGAVNALGLKGVTAGNGANAGELQISNANGFESVSISLTAPTSGGTLAVTTVNGAAAASPTSGTIQQRAQSIDFSTTAGVAEGDGFKVTVGSRSFDYVAGKGETMEDVARGLKTAIDSNLPAGVSTKVTQDATSGQWSLSVDDETGGQTLSLQASSGGEASGGLFGLDSIDVRSDAGAKSALSNIETMINRAIDSSAAFGSAQMRIDIQKDFVGKLSDALKSGIGTLVDADMEEASARLQALQVQQQLGVQALSIANQQPQNILALFR